jgi:plastocyanin
MGKITVAILLLVVIIGAVFLFSSFAKNPIKTAGVVNNPEENSSAGAGITGGVVKTTNVIEMTSSGFTPATLTISKGDTVTWVNKDTETHWPASASHPTHTVYPGSGIEKCGTSEESTIFDACKGIVPGGSYSFTFNEVGTWGYHDHLNPNLHGKIAVQ